MEERKLETLKVKIVCGGEVVSVAEIPDPREAFCEAFNEQAAEFGFHAEPALAH